MDKLFDWNKFTILDGGLGTMLQAKGLGPGVKPEDMIFSAPLVLEEIHREYIEAGAQVVCANTFGASRYKLTDAAYTCEEAVQAAVAIAKNAAQGTGARVAVDIGPLGELLEPAGTLSFEEAYEAFTEIVMAGERAGADLIMIETMMDLYETKAAVLAAVEQADLPVMVSMTFERDGRTFAGVPVEAFAATVASLGVSAIGINCSLGPAEILPLAQRLCEVTDLPVFIKPNAGLPDPQTGTYTVGAEEFLRQMEGCAEIGVSIMGGCCGTTPAAIRLLAKHFDGKAPAGRVFAQKSLVCSGTQVVKIDGVTPIGERINPTGKKRLQQALREGDMSYLQTQAVLQQQDGARILDVNVGATGVDEVSVLPVAVKAVQAVCDLPLQLDSASPVALEAALRVYNGKAIVNSTTGEKEKLDLILPLCKRYGAAVVGLTLDEDGIPETAERRFEIAGLILDAALKAGIRKEDVYIDCLTLTVSAQADAALATLEATRLVKERLGLKTLLGVSNVSFGLPNRPVVNAAFLTLALQAGLDLPILNPALESMMGAIAAFNLLNGKDKGAAAYIASQKSGEEKQASVAISTDGMPLDEAIEKGLKAEAAEKAAGLLKSGEADGLGLVGQYLIPALDRVGKGFERGNLFLPQLLAAANAAQSTFEVIRESFGEGEEKGLPVVVATVQGDVHDIGKNIAKILLQNYGYAVTDLGRDVPPEKVVEAAKQTGARLVGLSALMTTTLPALEKTVQLLRASGHECKILVGGAVLTAEYAASIGADYYAKDALDGVHAAQEIYGS